jgi:hypothetical protein
MRSEFSMRFVRGGIIFRKQGPLLKLRHGQCRGPSQGESQRGPDDSDMRVSPSVVCMVVAGILGERGLGLVVHVPSGCVAKINIP